MVLGVKYILLGVPCFSMIYAKLIKPILFKFDAEKIHARATNTGEKLGNSSVSRKAISSLYSYENKKLETEILGIKFKNPTGLAAGFDKDARLTKILPSVGFGYEEVGSIAGSPCNGNSKPRLFRLPKDNALVVNYGLCSIGSEIISKKLRNLRFKFPIGVSIVRANNSDIVMDVDKGIRDYIKAYENLKDIGDYLTINISCPNTPDKLAFSCVDNFDKLMREFSKLDIRKPVFIKLKPDFSKKEIDEFLKISDRYSFIKGFVISNLTKNNKNLRSNNLFKGGISGKPVKEKSNEMLKYVYKKTKGKYVLIGCGGIFNAEDAYEKIRNGASLLQLITGMIYNGPGIIKEINKGLVKLLEKDGFNNVLDAVGADVR
ncbi:MAG: dihydroorotate dehydrogenase (quinone) [Nanoarchaeota archaeon]|nr:dihydroorotate dehydrogenase (quinone) [Nanoarchaeota archaeon]|tara:strand:- start:1550 stop:2674 length:1125 start_codon:yes stop_codon:yes gene_type:complete